MRASGNPAGARQQVDVRRLHLGVFLDAREPGLAPQVRLLHTAQRCLGAVVHRGVDPHAARLHLAHGAQRLRQVLRPDGGREAENAVVGDGDGVLEGVEGHHGEHRSEDLLAQQRRVGVHAGHQRRLHEVAALVARAPAAADHRGAHAHALLHVAQHLFHVALVEQRTHLRPRVEWIADANTAHLLGPLRRQDLGHPPPPHHPPPPPPAPRPAPRWPGRGGGPAGASSSHSHSVEPLVASAGLTMAVQPAARMNGSRSARMKNGKFHGVITPTTPNGSRSTTASTRSPRLLCASPFITRAAPAAKRHTSTAPSISPTAWVIGLPVSSDSIRPTSSALAAIRSAILNSTTARSPALMRGQGPWSKAWRASRMACSASSAVPIGHWATGTPWPGLWRVLSSPAAPSVNWPPMNMRKRRGAVGRVMALFMNVPVVKKRPSPWRRRHGCRSRNPGWP